MPDETEYIDASDIVPLVRKTDTAEAASDDAFKLVYVDPPWAWFSTNDPEEEWGDDWNDTPYQLHAGRPYGNDAELRKVAYDGTLYAPGEKPRDQYDGIGDRIENGVAVEDMNHGDDRVPWLVETNYAHMYGEAGIKIYAGTTLDEFIELVDQAGSKPTQKFGGRVYLPIETAAGNQSDLGNLDD